MVVDAKGTLPPVQIPMLLQRKTKFVARNDQEVAVALREVTRKVIVLLDLVKELRDQAGLDQTELNLGQAALDLVVEVVLLQRMILNHHQEKKKG